MIYRGPITLLFVFLLMLVCSHVQAEPPAADKALSGKLLILAAASTTDVIEELRAEFIKHNPEVTIRASYAASSTLAKQIEAGAEADLFLSASEEWADVLAKKNLIARRHAALGNQLVLIVPTASKLKITGLSDLIKPEVRRLALADPQGVPAGIYARQALEKEKLWDQVRGKVAGADDVRQALTFVATGAAEAGIVYTTDAQAEPKVRVVSKIDAKLSAPIRYPLVLLKHGEGNPAAVGFYDFLASAEAANVFRQRGFVILPSDKP